MTLKDGGEVAVDWLCPKSDGPQNLLTIVILPGLTGDSQSNYIKETVNDLFKKGYNCVVLNYRGRGGVKLKVIKKNFFNHYKSAINDENYINAYVEFITITV